MAKLIRLKLLAQIADQGFPVLLEISDAGTTTQRTFETLGFLPPIPEQIESFFDHWRSAYHEAMDVRSCVAPAPGLRLTPKSGVTNFSSYEYATALAQHLNEWLNSGDPRWQPIRDGLIANARLHQYDEIRVLLDTDNVRLRRLPWQEWNLFTRHYPQAEVALSTPVQTTIFPFPVGSRVRIMVVVGRSDDIRTDADLRVIQSLREKGADITALIQPDRGSLVDALRDPQGYHIFIFTGHSGSQSDGQIGWIELNETDSLRIEDFAKALKKAIKNGLQLAIFNSCDGLGLAYQLAKLEIPQIIVMREPVPDEVAQKFLQHFFEQFTSNKSLFASIREARERLESFESKFPKVSWLPTICIGASVEPRTWQELRGFPILLQTPPAQPSLPSTRATPALKPIKPILWIIFVAGIISSALVTLNVPRDANPSRPEVVRESRPLSNVTPAISLPQGLWRYGGSTTWAPIRAKVLAYIQQHYPNFKLVYVNHRTLPPGSATGIKMLLDGQLSFSESSRRILDSEYNTAALRQFKLKQVPVAIDGIATVVHPDLPIEGLTLAQLMGIYTGQITNWNQVGGPNLTIVPLSRLPDAGGTPEFFRETLLGSQTFGSNVRYVSDTTMGLRQVGRDLAQGGIPGSIYYGSAPELVGQCTVKPLPIAIHAGSEFVAPYQGTLVPSDACPTRRNQLNTEAFRVDQYPLTRRLFVIIKQDGGEDQQAGEAYARFLLTSEGQRLIAEAGFVPIHSMNQ